MASDKENTHDDLDPEITAAPAAPVASVAPGPKAPMFYHYLDMNDGLEDTAEPDPEAITLNDVNKQKISQMVLERAIQENRHQELLRKIDEDRIKAGAKDMPLSLFVQNPSLMSDYSALILSEYPDITESVYEDIGKNRGSDILRAAEYSDAEVAQFEEHGPEFLEHLAVTDLHEKTFKAEGPSLTERVAKEKKSLLQMAKPGAGKALQIAGLAIGCATGGIVITAGLKAAGMVAKRVGAMEGVQLMFGNMRVGADKLLAKTLGITEDQAKEKTDKLTEAVEKVTSSKWAMVGKIAAISALAFVTGTLLFEEEMTNAMGTVFEAGRDGLQSTVGYFENASVPSVAEIKEGAGSAFQEFNDGRERMVEAMRGQAVGVSIPDAPDGNLPAAKSFSELVAMFSQTAALDSGIVQPEDFATYSVESGDNLWNISKDILEQRGMEVTNTNIQVMSDQLYEINKDVIGMNKDLIHPGMEFTVPGSAPALNILPEPHLPESLDAPDLPDADPRNEVIDLDKDGVAAISPPLDDYTQIAGLFGSDPVSGSSEPVVSSESNRAASKHRHHGNDFSL